MLFSQAFLGSKLSPTKTLAHIVEGVCLPDSTTFCFDLTVGSLDSEKNKVVGRKEGGRKLGNCFLVIAYTLQPVAVSGMKENIGLLSCLRIPQFCYFMV